MTYYPDNHHPIFFLQAAMHALGATAEYNNCDARTEGCYGLIVNGKPMAWLIDNRHPHEAEREDPAAKRLLESGALVCHAQKPDADRVGGHWLPLAVTPGYRQPEQPVSKLYDVGFVGYVRDTERMQVLAHVARHYKLNIAQGVFGDSAVSVYWQSKVGLNVPTGYGRPDAYDSANMRCFEILATGTALVTPHEAYLESLGLVHNVNCLTYTDVDELIKLIEAGMKDWYFKSSSIGVAGAKLAQERHTYQHRAQQVLEWLK